MKILFLHGWTSVPGGVKPTYLKDNGHTVLNPALDDDDFDAAVHTAQVAYDQHQPDVIVGSSRGGAVAMNIESKDTPLVLLCPAWKKWGSATTVKPNTTILHSRQDDVVPFAHSEELISISGLPSSVLIDVGNDHRLAGPEPLAKMLEACNRHLENPMNIEIIDAPIKFKLYGLSSEVEDHRYGEVGVPLMNEMWRIVKDSKLATTGINHWVYFADDRMLVGVELKNAEQAEIPEKLEPCDFELTRYSKHVHIGPYHELPQKWQSLHAELSARGESVTMPSLEVYGHSCEGDDESKAETTILMGLKPRDA